MKYSHSCHSKPVRCNFSVEHKNFYSMTEFCFWMKCILFKRVQVGLYEMKVEVD